MQEGHHRNATIDHLLDNLEGSELSLDWKNLTSENIAHVASKELGHIRELNLIGNQLTSSAIPHLFAPSLRTLQTILLNFNIIGEKGCKMLSKGQWAALKVLSLDSCEIQNAGISHLAKGKWAKLEVLSLNENLINRLSLPPITTLNAPFLKRVELSYNPLPISACLILLKMGSELEEVLLHGYEGEDVLELVRLDGELRRRFTLLKSLF